MQCKSIIFFLLIILSNILYAESLNFQVVEKEFLLTPDIVELVRIDKDNPVSLRVILTNEGIKEFNHFLINTYDKKLNIIFDGEIVQLSLPIKTTEFPKSFLINTKNKETTNKIFNYLHHKD